MKIRDYLFLYLIAVLVISAAGILQRSAGYMDAEYYAAIGSGIRSGTGFTQNFLWNYLDDPVGIPHPSNTYWMPLASILSAISFTFNLAGQKTTIWVLNIFFSALIPVITAWITIRFTKRRSDAWVTGLLAIFSGFYLLYYAIPETFTLSMVFGSGLIILLSKNETESTKGKYFLLRWVFIGIAAGLLHMTRAEGLLWFAISAGNLVYLTLKHRDFQTGFASALCLISGYLFISGAWYLRNLQIWDQPFPPGTNRALWITTYDQTFSFPASLLTFQHWAAQGIEMVLSSRADAFWMNIKSILAVQGGILLFPFIIGRWWLYRRDAHLVLVAVYYSIVFFIMTVVFPFAGSRGGFIHSAAGIQLFLWAMVPIGLDQFIRFGERKRGWVSEEARRVFQIGLVIIMTLLTSIIFYQRVIVKENGISTWLVEERHYQNIFQELKTNLILDSESMVMVKNPPGWFLITGSHAIVIPDGDETTLKNVAQKFGASILILEKDHVKGLDPLYHSSISTIGLKRIMEIGDTQVFQFPSWK